MSGAPRVWVVVALLACAGAACRASGSPGPAGAASMPPGEAPPITRAITGEPGQAVSNGRVEMTVAPVIYGFDRIGTERVSAGLVFDVIEVTVRNVTSMSVPVGPRWLTQGISDFRCYPDQPPPTDLRDPFPDVTLAPGQAVQGSLVFDNERQLTSRYLAYDDGKATPLLVNLRRAERRFLGAYPVR